MPSKRSVTGGDFQTTRWSVVIAAGDVSSPDAREALEVLCTAYWRPLYAYARSRGRSREEAEDSVQGFFCRLLSHNEVRRADPVRGRFRTFLLTAFQRFMANEWDHARANKRGGGALHLPLNFDHAEERLQHALTSAATPERLYEQQWALQILESALRTLRAEYLQAGRELLFETLKPTLTGESLDKGYAELGADLGMSEGAVKNAVYRLRKRYKTILHDVVADTVENSALVEEELRELIAALS